MGKAFVAKLAREGARDPEALAAWIGRKKHGKAFAKLAAKGRKDKSKRPAEPPEVRGARARVQAAEKRAAAARESADRANQSASDAYGRFAGGQKILTGHYSERSALRDRSRADSRTRRAIAATETAKRAEAEVRTAQAEAQGAEMRAARSRPWGKGDFQAGDIVQIGRAGRPGESYQVVRANAKSVTVSRGHAGMDNKSIPYDKVLSRTRDGETSSDPGADRPATGTPDPAKGQQSDGEQRAAAGFTAEEERTLEATKAQTAKMNMGQLQAFEEAYRPGSSTSTGRTRADDLRHEAVRREIERRHAAVQKGMDEVRKLNRGAHQGSFMMGQRPEGVEGMRLRRMSDENVNRNLQLVLALTRAVEENGTPMSRPDKSLLYDVASALRRENRRRNLPPVR
ncbi:hypothetical protein GCM10010294_25020 [Streptomyces griseoloalbus]|uniref:DUF3560 domain-containing protein n=1 Tax=Streptomyces griseoloalbus TaxID=67303 RepID=UPI001873A7AF|nr:hypothetical protein GCM10010294_25020 [Streptomyces griseoloalbus]